jgi:hypothetical protein
MALPWQRLPSHSADFATFRRLIPRSPCSRKGAGSRFWPQAAFAASQQFTALFHPLTAALHTQRCTVNHPATPQRNIQEAQRTFSNLHSFIVSQEENSWPTQHESATDAGRQKPSQQNAATRSQVVGGTPSTDRQQHRGRRRHEHSAGHRPAFSLPRPPQEKAPRSAGASIAKRRRSRPNSTRLSRNSTVQLRVNASGHDLRKD